MGFGRHYCAALALWLLAPTAVAQLSLSAWVVAGYDDNLANSVREDQALASASLDVGLALSATRLLGRRAGARITAELAGQELREQPRLAHARSRLGLSSWWALRRGLAAHWLELSLDNTTQDFDSEQRDGRVWQLSLSARQRWGVRLTTGVVIASRTRNAESAVFNLRQRELSLLADWRLSGRANLYARLSGRRGDQVSSVRPPDATVVAAAEVIVRDDALVGFNSYRLDAETALLRLGWAYKLNPHWGLDLRLDLVRSKADGDLRYARQIAQLALLYQF